MKLRCFFVFIVTLNLFTGYTQPKNKDLLFTVGEDSIFTSEFVRVYRKNLDLVQDESQKDIEAYLNMFINYKLKLREAKSLGLDKKPSYILELNTYKKQLSQNYLTDYQLNEALVNEAYNRILNEVEASHILVMVDTQAKAQDTLKAYNTIMAMRERAIKEGFEKTRKAVHDGQTIFGEDLGFFTAFKMVYPFENAAYNTHVGDISQPFRTQFGYHIVLVKDKRQSQGERTVAHIMIVDKEGDSVSEDAKSRIHEIHKKVMQGADFESLAKQFSNDINSASKGGLLSPFMAGQLSSKEFETMAFSLGTIGEVSKPFKTNFGWHIVKLYHKKPVESFEILKPRLEAQVKRDDRSKIIDETLHARLRDKYKVTNLQQPALAYFESLLDERYFMGSWELPSDFNSNIPLVNIENRQFYYKDFGEYLLKNQLRSSQKSAYKDVVSKVYESFLNTNLVLYQEDHLEHEDEDFANIVNEYKEGLLLFDLMENTIWNTTTSDTVELRAFYESQKERYVFPERMDAIIASAVKQNVIKKVSKLLASNMEWSHIKNLVNAQGAVDVLFTTGVVARSHPALPKELKFKKGLSKIYKHHDAYVVVKVKDILPQQVKTFNEVRGEVISDFQAAKEAKWLEQLKAKYKVEVNQESLNKVKSQIYNH